MAQTETAKDQFDPENPYALTQLERQVVDLRVSKPWRIMSITSVGAAVRFGT